MSADERVRNSLHRVGHAIEPDVDSSLAELRQRAEARPAVRRVAAVALAAAVVAAIVLSTQQLSDRLRSDQPAGPHPSPPAGLVVRDTFSAATLGIDKPLDVAVGSGSTFYVSDDTQHISSYSPRGQLLRRWGGQGASPGKLRLVTGALAVGPNDNVYVVDTGNTRVEEFSPSGDLVRVYGHFGQGAGFQTPTDVAVDDAGNVYVADRATASLSKLNADGSFAWERGGTADTPGGLNGHLELGGFMGGRLLATNTDTHQVLFVDPDGQVADVQTVPGACAASEDPAGRLMVLMCDAQGAPSALSVLDQSGDLVATIHGYATAPAWATDGTGVVLTTGGEVDLGDSSSP
jgi:DNA-binding beta-propeller fold protein YncE